MKHLKCKILNFDNALYYGEDIRINVRNKVINSITVYIPLDSRPSAIIDIYDTITGYTVKDLYPYEILTKLESYYPLLKDIHRSDLYNPQMYLSNFSVNCDTDTIIIAAEYGKCYSHNSYGIAGVSNWHIDSERSKLFVTIQGYLFASDNKELNKELNKKGDNSMKLQMFKINYGTLYSGNDINISVKDKIINNIKVYLPVNRWEPMDIFAIYDTITGHVPDYSVFPCMVLPVSEDLYPYKILSKLEILLPYIKTINRSELDNTQIYLTNIDMHYDNNKIKIEASYAKCRSCFPHALDLDVHSERAKLFKELCGDLFTDNTKDEELNEEAKKAAKEALNAAFGVPTFEAFDAITDELKDTYIKKNHDYGNSFDKSIDKFGLTAAVVRMSDKMERLSSLLNKDAKVDESIRDTVMDLANYCIMTAMYLDNKKEKK